MSNLYTERGERRVKDKRVREGKEERGALANTVGST